MLLRSRRPGAGLDATLGGAGAKLSIMVEIEGGTESGGALGYKMVGWVAAC
jgi:hypothetical protein